jgi:hypothetical protein
MFKLLGPIFRGTVLVLVLASLAGCPFEFGDEETILGACDTQADCPKHQRDRPSKTRCRLWVNWA